MTALRQQTHDLLESMPESDLCRVVDILEAFKRNENHLRSMEHTKNPFDFSKYMGRGEKMFDPADGVESYIGDSRADRELSETKDETTFVASRFGVAAGKFVAPDDIDFANDEIADLFEGNL